LDDVVMGRHLAGGIALVLALSAGGLGGYLLRRPPSASAAKQPMVDTAFSADLAVLQSQVAGIQQRLAASELRGAVEPRDPIAHADRIAPVSPGRDPNGDGRPPSRLSPEEVREAEARQMQQLDELARSEPRDRSWAPGYEEAVRAAVQGATAGNSASTIESLSCRTTICRLELSQDTPEAQRQFMDTFRAHLPPMAAMHVSYTRGNEGQAKTTVDFVREGSPIPGGS
jgi:hypothetical protein